MDNHEMTVRRSKIYTYFYGKKTVFQQFIIAVGVLLLLLSGTAVRANVESLNKKYDKLSANRSEAQEAYQQQYSDYGYELDVYYMERADVSAFQDDATLKTHAEEYNEALDKLEKAEAKLTEFREKDGCDYEIKRSYCKANKRSV